MKDINEITIEKLIKNKVKSLNNLDAVKRQIAKKYKTSCYSNVELLKAYHNLIKNKKIAKNQNLENILRKRKIRSLSGVVVVSVLTKEYPCPGKCVYCPKEKGLPQSYLSEEPAVERAKKAKFNPYIQTKDRLESLKIQGHPIDKIELRIIGGSWSVYPKNYQIKFVSECFRAVNEFSTKRSRPGLDHVGYDLKKQQKINEKAKHRIIGISIETRPDLINKNEILNLRNLGITMVELGVQTIYNDILKKTQRGHSVEQTIQATEILKNAGFKIMYQIMPNLPGSNPKLDFECSKTIFENPNFKPDWLKIYPCLVCKEAKLYQIWKKGLYKTYTNKELIKLLIKIKQIIPYWIRMARLFRDIPSQKIKAGSKFSNLRQIIQARMKKENKICHCIRCREIRENYNPKEKIFLFRENYEASNGQEIFLSFENKNRNKLYSLLRLRIPNKLNNKKNNQPWIIPVLKNSAIIREIHTYGQMAEIAGKSLSAQHKGLGKKLIKQAEKIAKNEFQLKKIVVISGIGTREYYRKLNYRLKNEYMIKNL
ncbi:MAG: tRNA uridine(34) 5-carboxymethylaminomethyl modification radical SAM/GNAT enzyme Elp3 [Patescibacteria group bacterium]|nr:tRNA uridine(34) 5-carboxymethylaminomethyl modification radical SAM/GNAT enzyme Elp3 [Patescibacteria group bacterium]